MISVYEYRKYGRSRTAMMQNPQKQIALTDRAGTVFMTGSFAAVFGLCMARSVAGRSFGGTPLRGGCLMFLAFGCRRLAMVLMGRSIRMSRVLSCAKIRL